jgi:hypothetical protein
MFHIAARWAVYLLAAPIMVYVALRPNGRALWLLPLLALFHVSVAGLLFGCILATEIVSSVRRRSVSLALVLSGVLFVAATAHTALTFENAVDAVGTQPVAPIVEYLRPDTFLPGVAIMLILLYAGYTAWRLPDLAGNFLLRAVTLAALLAGAGQVREVFLSAGYDLLNPRVYTFTMMPYYLSPLVCPAGLFLVMFAIGSSRLNRDSSQSLPNTKTLGVISAGVLALAVARYGNEVGRPSNAFVAVARGAAIMATQKPSDRVDQRVIDAASADDRYFVGPHPGDATSLMSILKMKARSAAGLLNPQDVVIQVIKRP